MSKCLSVPVPLGPGKPLGLLVRAHAHVGLVSRRTAQDGPRRSQAQDRMGRGGSGLLRVLGIVLRSPRVSPIASGKVQLLPERLGTPSQCVPDASDFGSAPVRAEPVRNHQRETFRGAWTHTESGARFERRRLMRMTHQAGF